MRTLLAMVSIGATREYAPRAFRRVAAYARRHAYDAVLVSSPLLPPGRRAHFEKLAVAAAFPGYDRYLVLDDDLYLSALAPALPEVPQGMVGLVPDAIQNLTSAPHVAWTGNTGFVLIGRDALDLQAKALQVAPRPDIWGMADQNTLNNVAWLEQRVHRLDARWNHLPIIHHIAHDITWDRWCSSRLLRISLYARFLLPTPQRRAARAAWGLHLVRAPGRAAFFDRLLP